MKKRASFYVFQLIVGICFIIASLFFNHQETKPIAGTLIGLGSGFVGLSISRLLMKHIEGKNPKAAIQAKIDYDDERNTMIRYRAKAKAGDITQWLIMAIVYITILISAPTWVSLAVVAVFLSYDFIGLYLVVKYQKEM